MRNRHGLGAANASEGASAGFPAAGSVIKDCAECPELLVVPFGTWMLSGPSTPVALGAPAPVYSSVLVLSFSGLAFGESLRDGSVMLLFAIG